MCNLNYCTNLCCDNYMRSTPSKYANQRVAAPDGALVRVGALMCWECGRAMESTPEFPEVAASGA
jgi:hypothetical protein